MELVEVKRRSRTTVLLVEEEGWEVNQINVRSATYTGEMGKGNTSDRKRNKLAVNSRTRVVLRY